MSQSPGPALPDVTTLATGPTNTLVDVPGLRVGHATRVGDGWLTGTTVVLAPDAAAGSSTAGASGDAGAGAVAGVDVRGGGPGTRETDLLDPRNMVQRVHAVVLTGGSAFGLAAADGVVQGLYDDGVGLPMGGPGEVVPIVPGAVIFDLGRGGDFGARPGAALGAQAYRTARDGGSGAVGQGCVGAGAGAAAGGFKGGIGSASVVLPDGTTVAALVVANPVGSVVDPRTGELYAVRSGIAGEFAHVGRPDPAEVEASRRAAELRTGPPGTRPALATTIGLIATDATLTKAQCAKVAGIGHDGMARAVRPVHTMFDGDTLFTLSTTGRPAPDPLAFHTLLEAAAECVTRAIGHAVLAAETVRTPAGAWRSWADAFPSAVRAALDTRPSSTTPTDQEQP